MNNKIVNLHSEIYDMRTLKLTLKKKWFDMIESGAKTEEYREITQYWINRLLTDFSTDATKNPIKLNGGSYNVIDFNQVHFFNGAHFSERLDNFKIECKGISIGTGRPEWGAAPGANYIVIKLGEKISNTQ